MNFSLAVRSPRNLHSVLNYKFSNCWDFAKSAPALVLQSKHTLFTRKPSLILVKRQSYPIGQLKEPYRLRNFSTEAVFSGKNNICEITGLLTSDTVRLHSLNIRIV